MLTPVGQEHFREVFQQFDEDAARAELEAKIENQVRAVALAGQILSLRNMPGYTDFRKALEDIREGANRELVTSMSSNEYLRVLQGKVQAYDNILAVMEKGENQIRALEAGIKDLQTRRALFDRPKKQTETK